MCACLQIRSSQRRWQSGNFPSFATGCNLSGHLQAGRQQSAETQTSYGTRILSDILRSMHEHPHMLHMPCGCKWLPLGPVAAVNNIGIGLILVAVTASSCSASLLCSAGPRTSIGVVKPLLPTLTCWLTTDAWLSARGSMLCVCI